MTTFVPPVSDSQASPEAAELFKTVHSRFGVVPNLFRVAGHQPAVLAGLLQSFAGIQGDLSPRLRELAYLRASVANSCRYCVHHHKLAAAQAGLSRDEVAAIVEGRGEQFGELERNVLRFADELTRTATVDEVVVAMLQEALGARDYVTLVATVCLANFTNRFSHACGVDLP